MAENEVAISAPSETQNFLTLIEKLAHDTTVDPAKISAILDIQERMIAKRAETEFNQAMEALQRELPRIKKDGTVQYENKNSGAMDKAFSFATWENVDGVIRPLMQSHGFTLSFDSQFKDGGGAIITGTLLHIGGHSRKASMPLPLDTSGGKNNLQGMGSTLSYGKRYTTFMLLNIVTEGEDDDGVRGGMQFIDLDSVKMINNLLAETKADVVAFLKFMEATEIENITSKDLPKAINALMTKKQKQQAAS